MSSASWQFGMSGFSGRMTIITSQKGNRSLPTGQLAIFAPKAHVEGCVVGDEFNDDIIVVQYRSSFARLNLLCFH